MANLLLAFQVGHDTRHLDDGFGHAISLDAHRLDPDVVAAQIPQGFLIARVPTRTA